MIDVSENQYIHANNHVAWKIIFGRLKKRYRLPSQAQNIPRPLSFINHLGFSLELVTASTYFSEVGGLRSRFTATLVCLIQT